MLSISCGRAFASFLVSSRSEAVDGQCGPAPDLADLFCEIDASEHDTVTG